jgi:hypothetical protein
MHIHYILYGYCVYTHTKRGGEKGGKDGGKQLHHVYKADAFDKRLKKYNPPLPFKKKIKKKN